jgi:hypothetical protein
MTSNLPATEQLLTKAEERTLLRAANEAGTPALVPLTPPPHQPTSEANATATYPPFSLKDFVRAHPVVSLALAFGIGYVLLRQRR